MMPTWLPQRSRPQSATGSLRRRAGRKAASTRLLLEALEERLVLSQITVIDSSDPTTLTPGTLRNAVHQANVNAAAGKSDTIVFDPSKMGGSTITLQQGPLELTKGQAPITITGVGGVTISGNHAGLIFRVDPGAQATLAGLTLTGGTGEVVSTGVSATVNGVTCAVTASSGGAIDNSGTLTIQQSTLTGNFAGGLYSDGGAISNAGQLTLIASTLSDNASTDVLGWGGGGAIYNSGTLSVTNSTLVDNVVTTGATVSGLGTSPNPGGGGAIDNVGSQKVTMISSTVAGNSASVGGGIVNAAGGQLVLSNTIVATNTAATAPDISGVVGGNNDLIGISSGMSGVANHDAGHNLVGTVGSPLDPRLGPVGNYGGPAPTAFLQSGSPAIAAGAAVSGILTDQRGSMRPANPDIGAFQTEAVAMFAVSAPAGAIAGVAFPVTVSAQDQAGNLVPTYSGTVTLTSSDKQTAYLSAPSINLVGGTATVMMTLDTPNAVTLTAASSNLTGTSSSIAVSPAVASFAVTVPATATAGMSFNVTITAEDRLGNTVTNYSGPVAITSSDGQAISYSPASITWTNGVAQVGVTLDSANTVTLSAGLGSVQGTSAQITVSPAAAESFTVGAAEHRRRGRRLHRDDHRQGSQRQRRDRLQRSRDPDQQRRPARHGQPFDAGLE